MFSPRELSSSTREHPSNSSKCRLLRGKSTHIRASGFAFTAPDNVDVRKHVPPRKPPRMKIPAPKLLLTLALLLAACACATFAQNTSLVADREAARRQAALPKGEEALGRAKAAMAEGNYIVAHQEFRPAINYLADAVN